MRVWRLRSLKEYMAHVDWTRAEAERDAQALLRLVPPDAARAFTVPGYSYPADAMVEFLVDFCYSATPGQINWRERLVCPVTGLNNRMRACIHLFDMEMGVYADSRIYLTEQVTATYQVFRQRHGGVVGSEYMGAGAERGAARADGVRHEDLFHLSFADASFDAIVSLDVLEPFPTTDRPCENAAAACAVAAGSCGRCLSFPMHRPACTAPRWMGGAITHHLEPEYHGDPLGGSGVLCYTHFGWDMLEQARAAGFRDAYALAYRAPAFGYLGDVSLMFFAVA